MGSIVVQVNNQEEINLLKNLLDRMKFSFETILDEKIKISPDELLSINKGIDEAERGLLKDSTEVHKIARDVCSR